MTNRKTGAGDLDPPIEIQTAPNPIGAVIWLHGLGADGNDFAPIVPALQIPAETPLRFIFPHAPFRPISINGNMKMRGWYNLTGEDFTHDQDRDGIEDSARIVQELITQENHRGIAYENIFLGGFSQGGAMALHTGLRFTQRLAGIIALSTYLPLSDTLAAERAAENQSTPIFLAHGDHDPLIPIHFAHTSKQQLQQAGYSISWHQYPIQHNVSAEEIADVADFLRGCMATK